MKRIQLLALVALALLAPAGPVSAGDVTGCCPLADDFSFIIDGDTKKNESAQSQSDGALDQTLHAGKIDGDSQFLGNEPHYTIEENKEFTIEFSLKGREGSVHRAEDWAANSPDTNAKGEKEEDDWSPIESDHPETRDGSPYNGKTCWQFQKNNSYWTGNAYWIINAASFAYHLDSPTVWGEKGGIGDNNEVGDEGYGGSEGKTPGTWKYVVPSAPLYYFVTAAKTADWKWDFTDNVHAWKHTPQRCPRIPTICNCQRCHGCFLCSDTFNGTHYHLWQPTIPIRKPADFYRQGGAIEKYQAATTPSAPKTYDNDGVSQGTLFDNNKPFNQTGSDYHADVARSSILVHDKWRITHLSFGDGQKAEWNTTTGEKVTDLDNHKVKFRLFDNAAHMRTEALDLSDKTWDDKFKNDEFKAIFWYEDVVYDYYGMQNPALGLKEVFYSPKFVLKKGAKWEDCKTFLSKGIAHPMSAGQPCTTNPQYVKFDLEFDSKELFDGQGGDKEDCMPVHYGLTALGDEFGGPRWELGSYDGEPFNTYEGVALKMKSKPINFQNGRGPLKCFFEIKQCSVFDEKQNGAGHEKFICDESYFFKDIDKGDSKYCEQVKFNPEKIEYVQEPKTDLHDASNGESVNAEQGTTDLPITKYEGDCADKWKDNPEVQNGKSPEMFQAWGKIFLKDDDRPGVGLRVYNKSSQKYRDIYYKNSIDKLEFYEGLRGSGQKTVLRNDEFGGPEQYTDEAEEWKFTGTPKELGQGEDEFTPPDKGQGYGLFEDVELEMSHNDLKSNEKHGSVLCFYAHDNIDGQRMKQTMTVPKGWFYKGVECEGNDREKYPSGAMGDVYANDRIGEGYKSWLVFDNSFSEPKMLEKYRPDGNNFIYPNVTFNNPNVKADGSELNAGASDIHVSYLVRDKAGNTRKFLLKFFVKAIDVNINTLERQDQKQ